jgi:DNA-binding GntR family transcriptional regulator
MKSFGKAQFVYEKLKEDIIQGKLSPKERLVERDLTEKFGVSKTPVREALTKLKQDGLVGGTLYRGMHVIHKTQEDAQEIFEIREVLEGMAARKVAERVNPKIIEKLNAILALSEQYLNTNEDNYYGLNLEFHWVFKDFCGNKMLTEFLERLYNQNRFLFSTPLNPFLNLPKVGAEISLYEHRRIVSAVIAGDMDLAEKTAKEHVRNTYQRLLGKNVNNIGAIQKYAPVNQKFSHIRKEL